MGGSKMGSTKATKAKHARRQVASASRRPSKNGPAARREEGGSLEEGLLSVGVVARLAKLRDIDLLLHELVQDVDGARKQLQALERSKKRQEEMRQLPLLKLSEARRAFERDYVARVLEATGGNQSEAARQAGMSRSAFRELMNRARSSA